MANAQQNVYINQTYSTEITDSEYLQVFSESNSTDYYEISSVRKNDPSNDCNISLPNIPSRQADSHGRQRIRISLWLLFPIIMCSLIAIVITGVVTFYITQEILTQTQFLDAHEEDCYWLPWSAWSKCSITCGDGVQVRIRQQMDNTMMCNYNETFDSQTCSRSGCPGDDGLLDMRFSRTALHHKLFISADNTILSNVHSNEVSSSNDSQLQNYRGTISDICIGKNELIYYEVNYTYTIVNALTGTNLVLEVGLAERSKVDRFIYVGNKNMSGWSFYLGRGLHNDNVYLKSTGPDSHRVWESFSNKVGTQFHGKFKLFVNRRKNEFSLRQDDSIFHVFKNVASSEKLCPVFAAFHPYGVHVKLQLMNSRNFTYYIW